MPDTKKTPQRSRTARPDPAPDTFAAQLRATMVRLNLDEPRAAEYLRVPIFTLRKWRSGERQPGAAVLRLLEVLGIVEAMAPALHASFLPPESRHVEKSGLKESTAKQKTR